MNSLKETMPDESNVPASIYQHMPVWSRRLTIGRLLINVSLTTDEIQAHEPEITIYNRLSALRAERGMSRQQLAGALGISYQTVISLERGEYNPSLELALRVSRLFALPVEDIFSYIGSHSYREYTRRSGGGARFGGDPCGRSLGGCVVRFDAEGESDERF